MAQGCCEGGQGKVELTTQVIFHSVRDNHRVVKAGEQQRHIFLEIKVKTTQRKVEIQFQKHSQLPETYWSSSSSLYLQSHFSDRLW